jgi:enterochelin esterase-like enzyme
MFWAAFALLAVFMCRPAFAGEIQGDVIASAVLGHCMRYSMYLPEGYWDGKLKYPVLYLLHGAGGDCRAWQDRGHIKESADKLIAGGAIPPAIIVMPDCPACWWVDGSKERAETAFWSDFVPAIDEKFRTIAARGGRLVAGQSAGGYGAVRFALRHPDKIAAAAALSPAVYAQNVPMISAARAQPPFLGADGKFNRAAWDERNYPALLGAYSGQPHRVPFYLLSGSRDPLGIAAETKLLFEKLSALQPGGAELRIVDGDHSWAVWEGAIEGAMTYLFRYAEKPRPVAPGAGYVAGAER